MDIVIIGSGNVASVLGRKFKNAGHAILQVYSRNASAASKLAYEWDTESTNYKSLINNNADLYLIAVNDDAIVDVIKDLYLPEKIIVHTAAAVPMEILQTVSDNYGVFYPLQSLRKEMEALPAVPIFFDGSNEKTKNFLQKLATSISPENVVEAGDDTRLKLHIAAVVVNNFVNHLYTIAEEYCRNEGLDFKQLLPLIDETASRIKETSPQQAQTGPAIRHDSETIHRHLDLLKNHPQLKNIYVLLTESIQQSK